ncbi:hypothetical protein Barb6_00987 [Bacteroidales bacterium Barb6]|nr:hypothetical protein Barb6_01009 [Bacteroidales bacterium Barb6]OAV72590.1 hypothetical protein Barb6_00987 [Bacteroidales bacterium Barb6]
MIDGYTLTDKMRKARRRERLTAVEQALFYELAAVYNEDGRSDVFVCSNSELCMALGGIDEKTLSAARQSLINCGLIFYKKGKSRRIVGMYSFEQPFETTETTTGIVTVVTGVVTPSYIKKRESKRESKTKKETIPNGIVKKSAVADSRDFDFSFLEDDFKSCFLEWLEYKRCRKEKYRTQKSVEACYKNLKLLSSNSPDTAKLIVEQSMANNWAGLFELNKRKDETTGKNGKPVVSTDDFMSKLHET